jgi:hypothetical protein
MAFRDVASTYSAAPPGSTLAADMPIGVVAGDRLLALITVDNVTASITASPSGWAEIASGNNSLDGQFVRLWEKKKASGSEGATQSWTFGGGSTFTQITIAAWSGRDNSAAATFATPTVNTSSNTTPITVSGSSGTAVAGDDVAVFVAMDSLEATQTWAKSAWTGSLTERTDPAGTSWISDGLATRDNVSAGAFGSVGCTATRTTGAANSGYTVFAVALPAPADPGPGPVLDASSPAPTYLAGLAASGLRAGTTATFSPPAKSWIYVALSDYDSSALISINKPTNTGTALAWEPVWRHEAFAGLNVAQAVWRAWNESAQSNITVTASNTWTSGLGFDFPNYGSLFVDVWTEAHVSQASAAAQLLVTANVTNNVPLPVRPGSRAVLFGNDKAGTAEPTSSDSIVTLLTSGAFAAGRVVKALNSPRARQEILNWVAGAALGSGQVEFITYEIIGALGPDNLRGPANQVVTVGATATFDVAATASLGTLTYQWQDNRTGAFTNVSGGTGATTASYTTATTHQGFQGRRYRCVITDDAGSTTSAEAALKILAFPVYLWTTDV